MPHLSLRRACLLQAALPCFLLASCATSLPSPLPVIYAGRFTESNRFRPFVCGTAHLNSGIREPDTSFGSTQEITYAIDEAYPFPTPSMGTGMVFKDFRADLFALQIQLNMNADMSVTALGTGAIAVYDDRTHVGLQNGVRLHLDRPGSFDTRVTFAPYDVFATRDAGKFGLFGLGVKNIQVFKKAQAASTFTYDTPEISLSRHASHLDYGYEFGPCLFSFQLMMAWGPKDVPGGSVSMSYAFK